MWLVRHHAECGSLHTFSQHQACRKEFGFFAAPWIWRSNKQSTSSQIQIGPLKQIWHRPSFFLSLTPCTVITQLHFHGYTDDFCHTQKTPYGPSLPAPLHSIAFKKSDTISRQLPSGLYTKDAIQTRNQHVKTNKNKKFRTLYGCGRENVYHKRNNNTHFATGHPHIDNDRNVSSLFNSTEYLLTQALL